MIISENGGALWRAPLCMSTAIEYVLSILNSFHNNIKFTYEQENNNRLPFRDVLFIRDDKKINSMLFRKDTHNDLYLHWD